MKKLIAIAIVAILFTGAAMAQFTFPTISPATGKFSLNAYCNATLTKTADINMGYISIPQTNLVVGQNVVFTLTGNSTNVNGKFDGTFTGTTTVASLSPGTGNLVIAVTYDRNYVNSSGATVTNENQWNGIVDFRTNPGVNPCDGTATFKVTVDDITIPGTAAPGYYEFPFTVSITQHL